MVPKNLISDTYTPCEVLDLQCENKVAVDLGLKWRERGPPGPEYDGQTWRGQQWRESSKRWANRGGELHKWYDGFYKAKHQGRDVLQKWPEENPKPAKKKPEP